MAETQTTPEPKSSPGELFTKQLNRLADYAQKNSAVVVGNAPAAWYMPEDFDSSLLDLDAISAPFSRQQQEEDFRSAVADPTSLGTTGDLMLTQLQGDLLASMERAFRARHHTPCRSRIQPAARLAGHAAATGVVPLGMLGYIVSIDRLNKSEQV